MSQYSPTKEGWVYFLKAEGLPRIKIGFAACVQRRLTDMVGHSPVKLTVMKQVQATYKIEQTLLALFDEYRLHGEWFHAAPELVSFIESLQDRSRFSLSQILLAR